MSNCQNPILPRMAYITNIIDETSDTKTFKVEFEGGGKGDFLHEPGQCAMLSIPGVGEAMISITSSPTFKDFLEFTIKRVGRLTNVIHQLEVGDQIGIRGPYGNNFPYKLLEGKDILFIAGGFALAPLRSLINYVLDDEHRKDYGKVDIIYGARSVDDLCFKRELFENWPKRQDTQIHTTIDRAEEGWDGHVAFVPTYLEELQPSPENKYALTCGPPIMIKFVLQNLQKLGYQDDHVITTLEMRMKCGIGKCGRCNIGSKYVCLNGPVFFLDQLKQLPQEY